MAYDDLPGGGAPPAGREVTCPECEESFVTDPPPVAPCPTCGYEGW